MRLIPIAVLALLAAGCAPTRQDYASRCAGRGAQLGTSDMDRCVVDSDSRIREGLIRGGRPPAPQSVFAAPDNGVPANRF